MIHDKKNKIRVFNSVEELNEAAAKLIADVAEQSVAERGRFNLCLSGGNTPKSLYTLLSSTPYRDLIPWKKTFIFWGDERCVPQDDVQNNAFMAKNSLLDKIDIPPANIFPVPIQLPPAEAAKKYDETIRIFFGNGVPRFDLILLGLGVDGHTASLFPGTEVLREKKRWVREVFVEEKNMHRISVTPLLINKAHRILFLIEGDEKADIIEQVLTSPHQPAKYPAQLVKPDRGEVNWFLDSKAAKNINTITAE